jgi:hypothetical protein
MAPYSDVCGPLYIGSSYVTSALQAMDPRPCDRADVSMPKATLMLLGGSFCAMAGVVSLRGILNAPCGTQRPIPPQFGSLESWLLMCGGASLVKTGSYESSNDFGAPLMGCLLFVTGSAKLAMHYLHRPDVTDDGADRAKIE